PDMTVVYILTAGGPFDSTQTLPSLAFAMGIQGSDLAAGAAISLFLVPLLVILSYFMLRVAHRAEVNCWPREFRGVSGARSSTSSCWGLLRSCWLSLSIGF